MARNRLIAEIINSNDEVLLTIDSNMVSCEFGALDRGNITDVIDWGIYANRGSISFIDIWGVFNNSNINYPEWKNTKVRFYLVSKEKSPISTFNIDTLQYNSETKQLDIGLISRLITWQGIKIYRPLLVNSEHLFDTKTLAGIIDAVNKYYNVGLLVRSNRLALTQIYCPDINDDTTVWDLMTQICQVGMCRIFDYEYGNPCIYDTMPNKTNIVINPNNIISVNDEGISSIPNANISVVERTKHIDELSETKRVSIFNTNGELVDFEQDVSISVSDVLPIYATVEYDVELRNNTFRVGSVFINGSYYIPSEGTLEGKIPPSDSYATLSPSYRYAFVNAYFMVKNSSNVVVTNANISFHSTYYTDDNTLIESYTTKETAETKELPTNTLLQIGSTFAGKNLSAEILDTTKRRYAMPIRCVEMECLLGEYSNIDGEVVLSKGQLFKKYDTVIPYVVRNGKKRAYSTDEDGNASPYEIVGIEYSYNGFLRQKLYLQEDRTNIENIFVSGRVAAIISPNEQATYFPWWFSGLESNKTYNISWSFKSSAFDTFSAYMNEDGYYCFYTHFGDGINYYPISENIDDVLNYSTTVTSNANGEIYIGVCMLNREIETSEAQEYMEIGEQNTNYAIAE